METTFEELGLQPELLASVQELGFESPSPVQAKTIPVALSGRDIVGISQTGSGKTAAFTLPALQAIDLDLNAPQVLVLCPTRELAVQVCEEVHRLSNKLNGVSAIPVYGGAPIDRQIRAMKKGVHIIIGTPGRVIDHLKRRTLRTENIRMCILDEADRMLDMGFRTDMETILDAIPRERQTLFFSATMNKGVTGLIRAFSNQAEYIEIEGRSITVDTVEQFYYEVRNRSKVEVMSRLLDIAPSQRGIVFCNTKKAVDECCEALIARGYPADRIHGDITQPVREKVLRRFRDGSVEILVATDVAARGLDIEDIDMVFNYDLPYDPEDYVHRIGRTGRAGRSGRSITFCYGRDIYRLEAIERYTRQPVRRMRIPSQEEVEGSRADKVFNQLRDHLEQGKYRRFDPQIDRLLDTGHTPTDIASALFDLLQGDEERGRETIAEDSEPFEENPKRKKPYKKNDSRGGRQDYRKKKKPGYPKTTGKRRFKRPN
jgi:ATP-dependent RNA helicase DeaD